MPDKNEYYEFLYAYTLGCLDEDDLNNLKKYLAASEDYYWQELGEFQNLASLLPSILPIESPDIQVKDKVARKLYRIRNEIKAKRDKIRKENKIPEIVSNEKIKLVNQSDETEKELPSEIHETIETEKEIRNEETYNEKNIPDIKDFEIVRASRNIPDNLIRDEEDKEVKNPKEQALNSNIVPEVIRRDETDNFKEQTKPTGIKKPAEGQDKISDKDKKEVSQSRFSLVEKNLITKKKSSLSLIIVLIAFLLLVTAAAFIYFKISSNVNGYQSEIVTLNQEISNLKDQLRQNAEMQSVLSSKNLKTVTLLPSDLAKNAYGNLFLSMDTNRGILQTSNLPKLNGNETYQLWIFIYNNYMSLGKIKVTGNSTYFTFDTPQLSEESNIKFAITAEPADGAITPSVKVYLTGSF